MSGAPISWCQERNPDFHEAEFYEGGLICEVVGRITVGVWCEGETCMEHEDGRRLTCAADFRAAFPDGAVAMDGEDGWTLINNGWFMLSAPGLDEDEVEPVYSLSEAVAQALQLAGPPRTDTPGRATDLSEALRRAR